MLFLKWSSLSKGRMIRFSCIQGYCSLATAQKFVPPHRDVTDEDVSEFVRFMKGEGKCLIVTGAGVSTESGIPDYRSEGVGLYASSNHRPVIYRDFLYNDDIRRRYWARNFTGWPQFCQKQPNLTHLSLKMLEDNGLIMGVVTQNVDSLHYKAGSRVVVELHGSAYRVVCLSCHYFIDRHKFQEMLNSLNQPINVEEAKRINPDGDVTIPEEAGRDFVVPKCPQCGGILKPDIVFFGDSVPKKRVEEVKNLVSSCKSIAVLGSSLSVYSSYRILLQAAELRKPILIVNIGPTRADDLAKVKLNVRCTQIFDKAIHRIL